MIHFPPPAALVMSHEFTLAMIDHMPKRDPAAVRWISAEPLLGAVNLFGCSVDRKQIWNWLSGETGTMHPDWARSLRDQCAAAGVAFNFKQWGDWEPTVYEAASHFLGSNGKVYGRNDPAAFGAALRKVGKKRAGRLLDGVQHDAFPVAEQ